ncbi:YciI family protein [Mucilaginibacter sp.]|uniref:YciI family protein n=1 Tax=Mucilaginibacter sp. TaxID=1882438 RepID=UPI003B008163
MKQYLISAQDFTDENAFERRMAARPAHLQTVKKLKSKDHYVIGGAMLNEEGKMIGSTMIVQFETPENLQEWLQNDPYITEKVWDRIEIKPFKVAEI